MSRQIFKSAAEFGRPIEETANRLRRDLELWGPALRKVIRDFDAGYLQTLIAYPGDFRVDLLDTDASFVTDIDSRSIVFNRAGIRAFVRPINRMAKRGEISGEIADIAREIAIEQFVIHELGHCRQNLISFDDVQQVKSLAGPMVLGELDVVADARTVEVCARLEYLRADERGGLCLASRVRDQLYVMGEFAFKAFKAPLDKPHKISRFLGLTMMAARAHSALESGVVPRRLEGSIELTVPLFPQFNLDTGSMLIFAFDADRIIWSMGMVDPTLLKLTCVELDSAPFAVSIARATELLRQLGRLPRR
jgi:hypothetical protein